MGCHKGCNCDECTLIITKTEMRAYLAGELETFTHKDFSDMSAYELQLLIKARIAELKKR